MKINILCGFLLISTLSYGREFPDSMTLKEAIAATEQGDPNCQNIYLDVVDHSLYNYNLSANDTGKIVIQAPADSPIAKLKKNVNKPRHCTTGGYVAYNDKKLKRLQGIIDIDEMDRNNDVATYELTDSYPDSEGYAIAQEHIPVTVFRASYSGFTSGHILYWAYNVTLERIKNGYAGNIKAIGCTSAALGRRNVPAKCDSKTYAILDMDSLPMYHFSDMKNCENALAESQKGSPTCDTKSNTLLRADMSYVHNKFASVKDCKKAAEAMAQKKPFCVTGIDAPVSETEAWWKMLTTNGLASYWDFESEQLCTEALKDPMYP